MKCKCSSLPEVFYLDEGPKGFEKDLKELDAENWMKLLECPECGALWVVDEWDKYSWQVASRIESRDGWPTPIPDEKRKQLLLTSRGGTTDQKCMWKDCDKNQVKGVAYCIDHLYETGARK
jgi:hypothetical protein